jgi:hypothetical protein
MIELKYPGAAPLLAGQTLPDRENSNARAAPPGADAVHDVHHLADS